MTKRQLIDLLRTLLQALVEAETPKPTLIAPPVPPPEGHKPYITADYQPCCAHHDETFEQSALAAGRTNATLERISTQAFRYMQDRLR